MALKWCMPLIIFIEGQLLCRWHDFEGDKAADNGRDLAALFLDSEGWNGGISYLPSCAPHFCRTAGEIGGHET